MLKVELHTHSGDDPQDLIPYSTADLIDRAADAGFQGLAITLHDHQLDLSPFQAHARRRGVVLIPGVERTIHGKHVLLLNFPACAAEVSSFEELADLKSRCHGLVIAPHPFYPAPHCLGRHMDAQAAMIDAVEYNGYYTRHINAFNQMAVRWARTHGKPVVASTDVHRLDQIGPTYTLVDADPTAAAICCAIRAGRVEIRTEPLSHLQAFTHITRLLASEVQGRLRRRHRVPSEAVACPPLAREAE